MTVVEAAISTYAGYAPSGDGNLAGMLMFLSVCAFIITYAVAGMCLHDIVERPKMYRLLAELHGFGSALPRTTIFHKGIISKGTTATTYDPVTGIEADVPVAAHLEAAVNDCFGDRGKMGPMTSRDFLRSVGNSRDGARDSRRGSIKLLLTAVPIFSAAGIVMLFWSVRIVMGFNWSG